jgi:hypothetical protein
LSLLVLGAAPGESLEGIDAFPVARHKKANAKGVKNEWPSIREVPRAAFSHLPDVSSGSDWMFGPTSE